MLGHIAVWQPQTPAASSAMLDCSRPLACMQAQAPQLQALPASITGPCTSVGGPSPVTSGLVATLSPFVSPHAKYLAGDLSFSCLPHEELGLVAASHMFQLVQSIDEGSISAASALSCGSVTYATHRSAIDLQISLRDVRTDSFPQPLQM